MNKLKQLLNKLSGNTGLLKINNDLANEVERLMDEAKNPNKVIKAIIGRQIKWVDYENLPYEDQKKWYQAVQAMKRNPAFKSLFGYEDKQGEKVNGLIVKDLIEGAVVEVRPGDVEVMRDMQMSINGVELIWQYIDEMLDPDINKKSKLEKR